MDDALFMRGTQRGADGEHQIGELIHAKGSASLEALAQILALKKFHHEVGDVVLDAHVGHIDRMGMANACRGLGLAHEAGDTLGARSDVGMQRLDRHPLVHAHVHGFMNRAHAALPEQANNPVRTERCTRSERCSQR